MVGPAPLMVARSLSRSFGVQVALDDVSLTVRAGSIHGLLGANGAGKSTLLRCILGLLRPDRGEVELLGSPIGAVAVGLPPGVSGRLARVATALDAAHGQPVAGGCPRRVGRREAGRREPGRWGGARR